MAGNTLGKPIDELEDAFQVQQGWKRVGGNLRTDFKFFIRLKKWNEFLELLEPVRKFAISPEMVSPSFPIFFEYEENQGRIGERTIFTAIGCLRFTSLISISVKKTLTESKKKELEDKGYRVFRGLLSCEETIY